jgi:hypothetical protein
LFNQFEDVSEDIDIVLDNYSSDVKELAINTIINYFYNKSYYCGGKIPKKYLINERNLNIVLNYNIENLMPEIYKVIEKDYKQGNDFDSEDIKLVVKLLKNFSKNNVPKEFSAGMLLIYLENCYGYKFSLIK